MLSSQAFQCRHGWRAAQNLCEEYLAAVALAAARACPGAFGQVAGCQAGLLQAQRMQRPLTLPTVQLRACRDTFLSPLHGQVQI